MSTACAILLYYRQNFTSVPRTWVPVNKWKRHLSVHYKEYWSSGFLSIEVQPNLIQLPASQSHRLSGSLTETCLEPLCTSDAAYWTSTALCSSPTASCCVPAERCGRVRSAVRGWGAGHQHHAASCTWQCVSRQLGYLGPALSDAILHPQPVSTWRQPECGASCFGANTRIVSVPTCAKPRVRDCLPPQCCGLQQTGLINRLCAAVQVL